MGKMGVNFKVKVPKFLKSVKYSLAAVNGVFVLTGLLLLFLGIAVLLVYSEYEGLITQRFYNVPGFVIATGTIILVTSLLGIYAAISEQFYFVAGYVVLLLVVLVFEIAIVIAAFSLKNDAPTDIRSTMMESLRFYSIRLEVASLWDNLQMEFECCGVSGRFDFISNQIPVSCCHMDYGTISPFECQTTNAYETGCAVALGDWLSYNAQVIAVCALVVTCIQIPLSGMGAWLAWRSKFEEVELES